METDNKTTSQLTKNNKKDDIKARKATTTKGTKRSTLKTSDNSPQERALSLYAQGNTFEEIADAENITAQEAVNLIAQSKERASTLQGIAMQTFVKANKIDKRGRIETLNEIRDLIKTELDRRGLEDVSSDKLVTLLLKTQEQLREEIDKEPIVILSENEQKRKEYIRELAHFDL